ncbi:sugar transferase [Halosimplex pelagicum]|uniref:Sugar transferase n=1 Tax=Halosimplex pelagicum TaxID=869886 RepID=A0A7D5TAB0_9EURY|nr:sugar transferase [Halosimplex pelagicum]QLH81229.1 sugar transferase [Halosimplex pelagicum]
MNSRWQYRVASVGATVALTLLALVVANHSLVQNLFALVPYFGGPAPSVLTGGQFAVAIATTIGVVSAAMWPVFKPRPRRILDTILLTQKRVLLAMVGLAALGYYNYTYKLPRSTLMIVTGLLFLVLPVAMAAIRRRPPGTERAVIVGDDPAVMADVLATAEPDVVGYVSPFAGRESGAGLDGQSFTDGGVVVEEDPLAELECLGGLSRLEEILVAYDVDTAVLAFGDADRMEFFGTLDTCYEHGVVAKVHRDHADSVLTSGISERELLDIDLEPWDTQDYVVKRAFDIAFAATGLVVLAPVIAAVALAVRLNSPGPVLYRQERTAEFGDRFPVYKFRSMVVDAESATGPKLSEEDAGEVDPRVTRVGRFLRQTHLDEIPQLWSILVGDMSVVGPRPERPELDTEMETTADTWRRRWFVRPGLTGLAQINDATGHDPEEKLRYDVEYIRRQSFWFDLKIVIRQLWDVGADAVRTVRPNTER